MTPAPRSIDDRYDLGTMLGRGGSAAVHRGWDRALEREVAIKVLPAEVDPVALERRRRETRLLASLSHPALVTLFDAVVAEDVTYLVMELVSGGTLRDRIARAPIGVPELCAIGADIAGALACIHERGIVHRDLTPANVLLVDDASSRTGAVAKLSDFGIAKLLETAPTRTTGIIGTARYLSPEQTRGVDVGVSSDVYSFGLCLIEAATGAPAFPGPPAEALAARLLRDPEVPRDLGYELRSLLTAMTRRDPDARPGAGEVQARLQEVVRRPASQTADTSPLTLPLTLPVPRGSTAEVAPPVSAEASPVRTGGRRRLLAVVATLAVLIGAGTILAFTMMSARTPTVAEAPASATSGPRSTAAATAPEPVRTSASAAASPRPSVVASRAPAPAPAHANGKGSGNGNGNEKGKGKGGGAGKGEGGGNGHGKH